MAQKNYGLVKDIDQLAAFVDRLVAAGTPFGFDIETGYDGDDREGVSLHPDDPASKVVGISFTNDPSWARYVPLAHDLANNFDNEAAAHLLWKLLRTGMGVPHNAKFELRHLARWFRETLPDDHECQATRGYYPVFSDTLIEAYIIAEEKSYGLKYLTKSKYGHDQAELISLFPGLAKNKMKAIRFNILDLTPEVVGYACEDSAWTLQLHFDQYPLVKDKLLYKVEMGIIKVLCAMEDFGVLYDWQAMREKASEGRVFLDMMNEEIQADLSAMVGTPVSVNLGSTAQVADILFNKLGLSTSRKTKSGAFSTDAIALAGLAKKHTVVQRILEWKEMRVLLTRYLEKYEKDYGYAPDGLTHPNHMQTAVASGRFAVSDPPYQQTPKKYHYELKNGRTFELEFRNLILAPPKHYILGFDFSQVELRMMAGESGEPTLLSAFENDEDVHTATAAMIYKIPRDQVTKDQRAVGKTMNFALLYGMSASGLSDRLALTKEEGKALYAQYFSAFSAIQVWMDKVTATGKKRGYSLSKFGRRFTIWELQSDEPWIYSKGERLCVNAPIQGAAADYMKIAMFRMWPALERAGLLDRVHCVMNIHDALEFYVHESVKPEDVVRVLAPEVTFRVPGLPKIVADWHIGRRWGSLTELVWDGEKLRPKAGQPDLEDMDTSAGGSGAASADHVQEAVSEPKYTPDNKQAQADHDLAAPAAAELVKLYPDQKPGVHDHKPQDDCPEDCPGRMVPETSAQLVVTISQMPDPAQYQKWMALLQSRPGASPVLLRTPEGDLDYEELRTGLTPTEQPAISLALGGATVKYAASTVDVSALTAGIAL